MFLILSILLILSNIAFAQGENFRFEPEGIPFTINGWQPFSPWTGGNQFSSPEFVDIDADGDLDLFLGVWEYLQYFENVGNNHSPNFELTSEQFDSISTNYFYTHFSVLYYYFKTRFVDIDADGDEDMVVWTSSFDELFYRNTGTVFQHNFVLESNNFLNFPIAGIGGGDFADLDADGDFDLIEGDFSGRLHLYINNGTPQSYNFTQISTYFDSIDVGVMAAPSLCDIDNDNDYDLFAGNEAGQVYYYRNDGDSANYNFIFVTDNYAGVIVDDTAIPTFCDIDDDGDYDLFVGMRWARYPFESGETAFYENIRTPETPEFIHITDNYLTFDTGASCIPQLTMSITMAIWI